jgi:hypothetical protein
MDEAAARDFAHLDEVHARAKAAAFKIMSECGRPFEAQPSSGNEPWRGFTDLDGPIANAARRLRGWP